MKFRKKTGVKKYLFKEDDLLKGVKKYLNLSTKEKEILCNNAYKKFKQDHKFFINKINLLLNNYKDKK
jgi:hypothetical protein